MSERTFNWIVAVVGALLLGYMLLAGPITQRAQQREEEPMPTQGQAAFGTILKRDGVAVAELVAISDISGREADTLNLTSHDSAERYHEFAQGLREHKRMAILGNHLPAQTGQWFDDFVDGDTLHGYTIVWPDATETHFRGFLTAVGTRGEIGGRLYWSAIIVPIGATGYWHCIDAPTAPGTPPPDDPEHWVEVSRAEAEAATLGGEPGFGHIGEGAGWHAVADVDARATAFPFASGAPEDSYQYAGFGQTWPASFTPVDDPAGDLCYSTYCVYDAATGLPQTIYAYLRGVNGSGAGTVSAGIYTAAGVKVVASAWQLISAGDAWATFDVSGGTVALSEGTAYGIWVQGNYNALLDELYIAVDSLANYEAPPAPVTEVPDWDPGEDYVYCNYVHYALD